jgi:adenine-specific DNA-methyltransferase
MGAKVFDNPKDHDEIGKLFRYVLGPASDDIVLDFFAGSGTTAEAILQINQDCGTSHRFVLVQLPEPCNPKERAGKAALAAGLPTIADVTKERVRRAASKLKDEDATKSPSLYEDEGPRPDRGFRVFKLAESNFTPWAADVPKDAGELAEQLEIFVDHIREDRSDHDLLFEILLKSGYPLTTPVDAIEMAGKTVHSAANGTLFICLERELTLELIRAMADAKPERVVCLDQGFAGNDQLKANAVQIFKIKGVTSFKTV